MYPDSVSAKTRRVRQRLTLGGLDRRADAEEGSLVRSQGLEASALPCLASGRDHVPVRGTGQVTGLLGWGELCTVEGTTLYYGGQAVGTLTPGEKQFAVVNTRLCVFPDKKYLDLNSREFGSLDARVVNRPGLAVTFGENSLSLEPDTSLGQSSFFTRSIRPRMDRTDHRKETGTHYYLRVCDSVRWDETTGSWVKEGERELWLMDDAVRYLAGKQVVLAQGPYDGGVCLNTKEIRETRTADGSTIRNEVVVTQDYQDDAQSSFYGVITDVEVVSRDYLYYGEAYVKDVTLTLEVHNAAAGNQGFAGRFFPGDRVYVSGCANEGNNTVGGSPLTVERVSGHTMTFLPPGPGGAAFTPGTDDGPVQVERPVPALDFVCQGDNRLFGVSNADGVIYASALGDPMNFEAFDGLATDSWRQSVGTAGDFTGCVAFDGCMLFWKEDCLHKLVGTRPAAYDLYASYVPGLQAGCSRSMAVVGDVLYYKSRHGVYAYSGGAPKRVSQALGDVVYDRAAGGGLGEAYHVSMRRADTGAWERLCYHTALGLWLEQDDLPVESFAALDGKLYALSGGVVYALGQGETDRPWLAQWVPFTARSVARKRPIRLLLELELEEGAWAEALVSQDDGPFRSLWTGHGPGPGLVTVPLGPGWCRNCQLRLEGRGRCVVRSLHWEYVLGSEA